MICLGLQLIATRQELVVIDQIVKLQTVAFIGGELTIWAVYVSERAALS